MEKYLLKFTTPPSLGKNKLLVNFFNLNIFQALLKKMSYDRLNNTTISNINEYYLKVKKNKKLLFFVI